MNGTGPGLFISWIFARVTVFAIRADEARQCEQSGIGKELRNFPQNAQRTISSRSAAEKAGPKPPGLFLAVTA